MDQNLETTLWNFFCHLSPFVVSFVAVVVVVSLPPATSVANGYYGNIVRVGVAATKCWYFKHASSRFIVEAASVCCGTCALSCRLSAASPCVREGRVLVCGVGR